MQANKIDVVKLAFAGGIYAALIFALSTVLALLDVPGFASVVDFFTKFYGYYGYSVSWMGVIMGAFWGFVD